MSSSLCPASFYNSRPDFYSTAQAFVRRGDVMEALDCYCDFFLFRSNVKDTDPLWFRFFEVQMRIYLLGKKNLHVSIPEGDMVFDLIRDSWLTLKKYLKNPSSLPIRNFEGLIRSVTIDFPWDESSCINDIENNDFFFCSSNEAF